MLIAARVFFCVCLSDWSFVENCSTLTTDALWLSCGVKHAIQRQMCPVCSPWFILRSITDAIDQCCYNLTVQFLVVSNAYWRLLLFLVIQIRLLDYLQFPVYAVSCWSLCPCFCQCYMRWCERMRFLSVFVQCAILVAYKYVFVYLSSTVNACEISNWVSCYPRRVSTICFSAFTVLMSLRD
jgi:hypothetical protein